MIAPVVEEHGGVHVVRDDLFPGGTKARYFGELFIGHDEVVYASPAEGGAQTALAYAAREAGKRATIFIAKRAEPHPRALAAKRLGAQVVQVKPGYLNVVQARAEEYCRRTGALLVPFGGAVAGATDRIAEAARATGLDPSFVWCAGGSGTLAAGLRKAWPLAVLNVVQVGRDLEVPGAKMHKHHLPFGKACKAPCPFPSDPHYDRKAWEWLQAHIASHGNYRDAVFWNVTGPAEDIQP